MKKKNNTPKRVSVETFANGQFHDAIRKRVHASVEKSEKYIIPRKKKYRKDEEY